MKHVRKFEDRSVQTFLRTQKGVPALEYEILVAVSALVIRMRRLAKVVGATLFFFIGWTFVGLHHAVMDNVIWRRESPEFRRYLFEA